MRRLRQARNVHVLSNDSQHPLRRSPHSRREDGCFWTADEIWRCMPTRHSAEDFRGRMILVDMHAGGYETGCQLRSGEDCRQFVRTMSGVLFQLLLDERIERLAQCMWLVLAVVVHTIGRTLVNHFPLLISREWQLTDLLEVRAYVNPSMGRCSVCCVFIGTWSIALISYLLYTVRVIALHL